MTVRHRAIASDSGLSYFWSADSFDNGAGYPGTGMATDLVVVGGLGPGTPSVRVNPGPAVYAGDNDWEQFSRAGCALDGTTDDTAKAQTVLDTIAGYSGGKALLRPNARMKVGNLTLRSGTTIEGAGFNHAGPATSSTLVHDGSGNPVIKFDPDANDSKICNINIVSTAGSPPAVAAIDISGAAGHSAWMNTIEDICVNNMQTAVRIGTNGGGSNYDANRTTVKRVIGLNVEYGVYIDAINCTAWKATECNFGLSNVADAAAFYLLNCGFGKIDSCNCFGLGGSSSGSAFIRYPTGIQNELTVINADSPEGMQYFLDIAESSNNMPITVVGGTIESRVRFLANSRLHLLGTSMIAIGAGGGVATGGNSTDSRIWVVGTPIASNCFQLGGTNYVVQNGLRRLLSSYNPDGFPANGRTTLTTTGATVCATVYPNPVGRYRVLGSVYANAPTSLKVTVSWHNLTDAYPQTRTIFDSDVTQGTYPLLDPLLDCGYDMTPIVITATAADANVVTVTTSIDTLEDSGAF